MISWLRLLFLKAEEASTTQEQKPEPKLNLKKLTKGDLKKLYEQGKIEAKDLKP